MYSKLIKSAFLTLGLSVGWATVPGSAGAVSAPTAFIRVLGIGGSGNEAANIVFSSGDLSGSIARTFDPTSFNAMTPAALRATYDLIYVTWMPGTGYNLDWTTRLRPFVDLGGSIIWEDPQNVGQLAPAIGGQEFDAGAPFTFTAAVPGLTDGIAGNFVNRHTRFLSWHPVFQVFMMSNADTIGLYATFPSGGRVIVTGPDQDFHSVRPSDQYSFLVNELSWASSGSNLVSLLKAGVTADVNAAKLSASYGSMLNQILGLVQLRLNQGNPSAAIVLLRSFINYVNASALSGPDKTALNDQANYIILGIQG